MQTRNAAFLPTLWSIIFCLLPTGCSEQQQQAGEPIYRENINKSRVMEIAEDVLAKMYFTIDKVNIEDGYIRTKPLPGAQFFEFWRSDNVGTDNWLINNLHSVRRTIELKIDEKDKVFVINCDVQIHRLSLPERKISSSAHAYDLFSASNQAMQSIQLHPEQQKDMAWIDIGKDEKLATEIVKRIEQRIASEETESKKI